MQETFDLYAVSGLLENTVLRTLDVAPEDIDEPDRAGAALATRLTRLDDNELLGYSGYEHFLGGFQLAVRLMNIVLADPLHVHRKAALREIECVEKQIEETMTERRAAVIKHGGKPRPNAA